MIELGFRVPEDVSVIGADDISYARFGNPALTTIRVPRDRLGILAYEALARMLKNKRRMGTEYWLETSLVVRGSTGPARIAPLQTRQTQAIV